MKLDKYYWTYEKDEESVLLLIDNGLDINDINESKETLLQVAVKNSFEKVVERLLELNVNPNIIHTSSTPSPLYRAAQNGNKNIVNLLLKNKADVDLFSYANETALMAACTNNHKEIVEILIEAKANVNMISKSGISPLLLSAELLDLDIAEMLINKKAEILHKDNDGRNATDYARKKYDPIFAQAYRDMGIPDIYSMEEDKYLHENDSYNVFISYKQMHFANDVDKLKKYFEELDLTVFVDRDELNINSHIIEPINDVKNKLKKALNNSKLTIFYEVYWDGSHGEPKLDTDNLNWQFFELLHSKEAVLLKFEDKCCSKFIKESGHYLESEYLFDFKDYREFSKKIIDIYFN